MSPENNSPIKGFRPLGNSQSNEERGYSPQESESQPLPPPQFGSPSPAEPAPYSPPPVDNPFTAVPQSRNSQPHNPPPPPWQTPQQPKQRPSEYQAHPSSNGYPYQVPAQVGPNPNTAYVIELIGGLFGLFGIGHMYAGNTGKGVTFLLIGISCNLVVGFFAAITAGIVACLVLPIYIVLAIVSANSVKNMLLNKYQQNP